MAVCYDMCRGFHSVVVRDRVRSPHASRSMGRTLLVRSVRLHRDPLVHWLYSVKWSRRRSGRPGTYLCDGVPEVGLTHRE